MKERGDPEFWRIRDCPATVNGDETRVLPLPVIGWEGAGSRAIRESGNLVGNTCELSSEGKKQGEK